MKIAIFVTLAFVASPSALSTAVIRFAESQSPAESTQIEEAARINAEVLKLIDRHQYTEAEPLAKRAIEMTEKSLGKDHESVASALNNLAAVHLGLYHYAEAEPLYQRSLSILEKKFGTDSKFLVSTLEGLAVTHFARRDFAGCEKLYLRGLSIREKEFGLDHPDVSRSLVQLARFYERTEKFSKSADFYKRSLAIQEKRLGPDHRDLVELLENCSCALILSNKRAEGEQYRERAFKILGPRPEGPMNKGVIQGFATVRAEPQYPSDAKRQGISGSVVVRVLVDECGIVVTATAITGPSLLRQASEDAAKLWRFSQTKFNGYPIKVIGTITFNYHI